MTTSWLDVSFSDILRAYRKAKVDCFFDKTVRSTEDFVSYEYRLFSNLQELTRRLQDGQVSVVLDSNIGTPRIHPKRLNLVQKTSSLHHAFFSDPERSFDNLQRTHDLVPEFRVVGDFGVDFHVVSALWIELIGSKYDAKLQRCAYGSRVRRFGSRLDEKGRPTTAYHGYSPGSFEPYYQPYRRWRDDGINSIKAALDQGQKVVALSLDFSSYYHKINPEFMTDPNFLGKLGLELNQWETSFTQDLVTALSNWAEKTRLFIPQIDKQARGGLPIGSSAVRIISNVLLAQLDLEISEGLNPLYYGRYVDDIFLVLQDPMSIRTSADLWNYVSERVPSVHTDIDDRPIYVDFKEGYSRSSRLEFQPSKQKIFFLNGQAGKDLLSSIAQQIRSLSSERRLMPLPEDLDATASARVLAASNSTSEDPDTLRRADGITIRRLGWALQLRSVEILGRDLNPHSWRKERLEFYKFAKDHILTQTRLLEQFDYIPRIIGLAVSMSDWEQANSFLTVTIKSLDSLRRSTSSGIATINGIEVAATTSLVWEDLQVRLIESCREALIKSLPWDRKTGKAVAIPRRAHRFLERLGLSPAVAYELALETRESDLASKPYKAHLRADASRERPESEGEDLIEAAYTYGPALRKFLDDTSAEVASSGVRRVNARCRPHDRTHKSILPFLAPTRPYSVQEIALYRPDECVFAEADDALASLVDYAQVVRGTWSRPAWPQSSSAITPSANVGDPPSAVAIGTRRREMKLGISSLLTTEDTWACGASGNTDLSPERYGRLAMVVNQAIRADPAPTHLLLPELSLPEQWLDTLSSLLLESRISLIAGLDYEHDIPGRVSSSAVLILTDDRLGYPHSIQIRQPKALPAPREDHALRTSHGKLWRDWSHSAKHTIMHHGVVFGVLVCSELQNVSNRQRFQGNVDWVAVLSWNQDLDTFAALVESATLDVHAYIALVNNRAYGDSRVRSPAKQNYRRDVCRLRGGLNDHVVVVRIDPTSLRAQQSRAERWPMPGDLYKPAPEGFLIAPERWTIPS